MKNKKFYEQQEEQFNLESALTTDGIDVMQINISQLKTHNDGLQTQNAQLQKDLYATKKAFKLFIIDYSVAVESKILSDKEVKKIIDDYTKQAKEALEG